MVINMEQSLPKSSEQRENAPKGYNVISYENRIRLIEEVCIHKKQIIQIAAQLNIKLSTAKYILRSFRKNGKVLKKMESADGDIEKFTQKLTFLKAKIKEINQGKLLRKIQYSLNQERKNQTPVLDRAVNCLDGQKMIKIAKSQNLQSGMEMKDVQQRCTVVQSVEQELNTLRPDLYLPTMCFYLNPYLVNLLPIECNTIQW